MSEQTEKCTQEETEVVQEVDFGQWGGLSIIHSEK